MKFSATQYKPRIQWEHGKLFTIERDGKKRDVFALMPKTFLTERQVIDMGGWRRMEEFERELDRWWESVRGSYYAYNYESDRVRGLYWPFES